MRRRSLLAAAGALGATGLAGCGLAGGHGTLSNPTERRDETDGSREHTLEFSEGGDPLADLGMRATVDDGAVRLPTSVWHRDGTDLTGIELRVRVTADGEVVPARVWLGAPLAGDGEEKPSLSLYASPEHQATVVDIDELGDLRDETVRMNLLVEPLSPATAVTVDGTVDLEEGGALGDSFTLEGTIDFAFEDGAFADG